MVYIAICGGFSLSSHFPTERSNAKLIYYLQEATEYRWKQLRIEVCFAF